MYPPPSFSTAKAIEYMIVDGLLAADPYLRIAEQVDKPEKYVYLTDDIMPNIESRTTEPVSTPQTVTPTMPNHTSPFFAQELEEARAIFYRIRTRDLYRCVDYKAFGWEYRELCRKHITPEHIVAAAKSLPPTSSSEAEIVDSLEAETVDSLKAGTVDSLEAKHVIVDFSPMHYGMEERNPLDFIRFYSKQKPDQCAQAGPGDLSILMPAVFGEVLLRVYTRDVRYFGIIQAGYREVLKALPDRVSPSLPEPSAPVVERTPSPPSTPRGHSRNTSFTFPAPNVTPVSKAFSNNTFTTVAPNFVPRSPTQEHRKPRSKRERDDDSPVKKRRVL